MSIARQKKRSLLLALVLALLAALAISLTISSVFAHLGIVLWHNAGHMLAFMSHWP